MKISVITVSYNSENTIKDTIESVLEQTFRDIEYIVVDGLSNDGTIDIVKSYEDQFRSKGISFKWISEKDNGLYDAINKGIKIATGDVIGILNSDDFYLDNMVLNDIAGSFNSNIDCTYGNLVYVKADNTDIVCRRWVSKDFKKGLFEKSWTPAHPTFYCKKSIYEKYGLYRTDFTIASDVDLMYRFLDTNNIRSRYIDRVFIKMRAGGVSNRGFKSTLTIIKELSISINENGGKFNILKYMFYKLLKIKQIIFK